MGVSSVRRFCVCRDMVGILCWDAEPLGPCRHLAMLGASGLRFSRSLVPHHTFHRHAYDLMGSREQYARKYHDCVYSPLYVAMPFKPEKPYKILLVFVWSALWL